MTPPRIEITGGADEGVAAAVAATVAHLIEAAAAAGSVPPTRPAPSAWTQAARPLSVPAPLPSGAYHPTRWATAEGRDHS